MSRFWAGLGLIRKRKVQCGALFSWFNEIVLISNNMSVQVHENVEDSKEYYQKSQKKSIHEKVEEEKEYYQK